MRMDENFSGCRVFSYCLMCNHGHLLLEEPPMGEGGLSDEMWRSAEWYVAGFATSPMEQSSGAVISSVISLSDFDR